MWSEVGERTLLGPALIKEAEDRVAEIREKLKAAQSRKKIYTDKRRRNLDFKVGEYVYLKVSPIQGTLRFRVCGKLAPQYIVPYQVLRKVGAVTYQIQLPQELADVHNVFHVSQLKKCLRIPKEHVTMEILDLQDDIQCQKVPVKILDVVTRQTRGSTVRL